MNIKNINPTLTLTELGAAEVHKNYGTSRLYEYALRRDEGRLSETGSLVCMTTPHTGRSPEDKYIVLDEETEVTVHWNKYHKPFTSEDFERLYQKVRRYLQGREVFMQDVYVGADPRYRVSVRIFTENAWHSLFARNMFRQPPVQELKTFHPQFTLIQVPNFKAQSEVDKTRSDAFVIINFQRKLILIGGTSYAGEIKKSVFSLMNYLLPRQGVFPMHCSANQGKDGKVALFFGLSGTGKTTLSSDSSRQLIGDDEHGWSRDTLFNFEGGCYAKVIGLNVEKEPEIYHASQCFGTILENVGIEEESRQIDFQSAEYTENTRSSYPVSFIPNINATGIGEEVSQVIFLTADAFGVLPPIARLTLEQTRYHFLSGYTARLAGTEKGIREPQAVFSACFGAPFMPCHPKLYADMLEERLRNHAVECWLINTGWIGGEYGIGQRISLHHTRTLIKSVLDTTLQEVPYKVEPYFGLNIPCVCPEIPSTLLNPEENWSEKSAYKVAASRVVERFEKNFQQIGQ